MAKLRTVTRQAISVARQQHRHYSAPTDGSIPAAKAKYVPSEGTYPKGFLVGSAHAGVKPSNTRFNDLALFASEKLCNAAGVFTVNAFKAAPVQVSRQVFHNGSGKGVRGVVINSGCANAVTGNGGIEDAIDMATKVDACFPAEESAPAMVPLYKEHRFEGGLSPLQKDKRLLENRTLVMSTGVIGQRLPITRITAKIPELYSSLGGSHEHWLGAAKAICTTDTFPKLISRSFTLPSSPNTEYRIAGTTKGAGMIHPNMATLLSVICTDASVEPRALHSLLRSATQTSFNSISIDGDTSTNDTVNLFANGAACPDGVAPITIKNVPAKFSQLPVLSEQSEDYKALHTVLCSFMADLAQLVVRDGEGATKFVTIRIQGALDNQSAHKIANSIARSPLVKTALYGKDANWGRILCAIGYSDARHIVLPRYTSVSFIPSDGSQELKLLTRGEPENVDEARAKEILEMEDLEILVKLSDGMTEATHRQGSATMWTCDFSHEYVTINGDYRT